MFTRALVTILALIAASHSLAAEPAWVASFDGKTLDGWTVRGGTAKYEIIEGTIVGTTVDGSPNTFLCRGPYGDFELEFDVLCDLKLNSGVQIRSHVDEKDTPPPSDPKRIRKAGEVYASHCKIARAEYSVPYNFCH